MNIIAKRTLKIYIQKKISNMPFNNLFLLFCLDMVLSVLSWTLLWDDLHKVKKWSPKTLDMFCKHHNTETWNIPMSVLYFLYYALQTEQCRVLKINVQIVQQIIHLLKQDSLLEGPFKTPRWSDIPTVKVLALDLNKSTRSYQAFKQMLPCFFFDTIVCGWLHFKGRSWKKIKDIVQLVHIVRLAAYYCGFDALANNICLGRFIREFYYIILL